MRRALFVRVLVRDQLRLLEPPEAVRRGGGEALVGLRLLEAGARLLQSGLRLREVGLSLRQARARLGERRARLAQFLVELRRVDLGQHLAGRDAIPDVDEALADVAARARVHRRLLDRLDVARQQEIARPFGVAGRDDAHGDHAGVRRGGSGHALRLLTQPRHDADDQQRDERHHADEDSPPTLRLRHDSTPLRESPSAVVGDAERCR